MELSFDWTRSKNPHVIPKSNIKKKLTSEQLRRKKIKEDLNIKLDSINLDKDLLEVWDE